MSQDVRLPGSSAGALMLFEPGQDRASASELQFSPVIICGGVSEKLVAWKTRWAGRYTYAGCSSSLASNPCRSIS